MCIAQIHILIILRQRIGTECVTYNIGYKQESILGNVRSDCTIWLGIPNSMYRYRSVYNATTTRYNVKKVFMSEEAK